MKSFETGLQEDIAISRKFETNLRLSGLSDEDLMRHVNELASHQVERDKI